MQRNNRVRDVNYSEEQYLNLIACCIPFPDEWEDYYYEDHPEELEED